MNVKTSAKDAKITLLTTTEVAERFKVDTSAVRRWVAKGHLTPTITTPGGHYRFDASYIESFTEQTA